MRVQSTEQAVLAAEPRAAMLIHVYSSKCKEEGSRTGTDNARDLESAH